MDFGYLAGSTDALDNLATLAASYGGRSDIPAEDEDIEIGADVGEDLESDVEDEEDEDRGAHSANTGRLPGDDDVYGDDDADNVEEDSESASDDSEEMSARTSGATPGVDSSSRFDLAAMFPSFRSGAILDFTDLLSAPPKKKPRLEAKAIKIKAPNVTDVPLAQSSIDQALEPMQIPPPSQMIRLLRQSRPRATTAAITGRHADEVYDDLIARSAGWDLPSPHHARIDAVTIDDWADRVVWSTVGESDKGVVVAEPASHGPTNGTLPFHTNDIDTGDWTRSIIWSKRAPFSDFTRLQLSVAQMALLEEEEDEGVSAERRRALLSGEIDLLNISNDKIYEAARERRSGVRQTLSSLEVQHGYPAKKLQLPFYKIQLSKSECRAFHRPPLQFPVNLPIIFTKVRSTKKKRDKVSGHKLRSGEDVMHSTTDLSLRDTGAFVLLEFSEEYPPIMSNLGMGSILVNYYRKRSSKEEITPAEFGETFVLEPSDETPFRKFGDVKHGETVQALYNNLIRAPIFRHTAATSDFVVVRVSGDGETRYYLREIKNLYVVGQTLPLKEVPGPHSRRLTSLTKARLMLIARRLCARSGDGRCHIQQLLKYFDDHTSLQMRQRIKDFMEFQGNSSWAFKPSSGIPSELDNREVASPEEIVLYETMQVGQRHLLDAGYGTAAIAEGGNDDDGVKLDVEQQLAPWTSTKNFLLASQSKAMLALNGEGEPTGRGEGFSFLRISMKDVFVPGDRDKEDYLREQAKYSKKYNVAEQQDLYKKEIDQIWARQAHALSDPKPPSVTAEDEARARATPGDTPYGGISPSGAAETPGDGDASKGGKILKIKRKVNGRTVIERIRDPKVITAYIRQRQIIEEETLNPEDIEFTNDTDANERNKAKLKKVLATLKRNQQRRLQRRLQMAGAAGLNVSGPNGAGEEEVGEDKESPGASQLKKSKQSTTRVCGNCGQTGHMKTNKTCPRYHEFHPGGPPKKGTKNVTAKGEGAASTNMALPMPSVGSLASTNAAPAEDRNTESRPLTSLSSLK